MAIDISAKLNAKEISAILKQYTSQSGKLNDLTKPMRTIGAVLKSNIQRSFRFSKDPYGNTWEQLQPYWKYSGGKKKLRDGQPLRDTGRLMNSITYRANKNSAIVGTNVEYARTHQEGLNGVTAREFMPSALHGLPKKWKNSIVTQINKHIND